MIFVKLTPVKEVVGTSAWVKADDIVAMIQDNLGTVVAYGSDFVYVKETPEEILRRLEEAVCR